MKVDKEQLRDVLKRLQARKSKPPPTLPNKVQVDREMIKGLLKYRPRLITELAQRMDKSRHGIYWMMRPEYGNTPRTQEEAQKLNEIVKELLKETQESLNRAANK